MSASGRSPLQKVIGMLEGLRRKGEMFKQKEEVGFATFHAWCDDTRAKSQKRVASAEAKAVQLQADLVKARADAEDLAADIQQLEASIAGKTKETAEAVAIRRTQRADYEASNQDLSESLRAVDRAVGVLRASAGGAAQALLQLGELPQLPAEARYSVESFLAMQGRSLAAAGAEAAAPAPAPAPAYDFQSGGVLGMLEDLRQRLADQKESLEKEELAAQHSHKALVQRLQDGLKADRAAAQQKTAAKARALEDASAASGDLDATQASRAQEEAQLQATLTECHKKSEEFEANQKVRAAEIAAIQTALAALRSKAVSVVSGRRPAAAALLQGEATALAQLLRAPGDGTSAGAGSPRARAAALLRERARLLGSQYLQFAAARAADPFVEVRRMIEDLLTRLREEAAAEADKRGYCQSELATNKLTREDKQAQVEELSALLERHSAQALQLAAEVRDLSAALEDLGKERREAAELRGAERARNAAAIAEAREAQAAVEAAKKALADFYAKAADGASLLQSRLGEEMLQAARAPYTGMQAVSGSVLGLLDTVLSDFARLESETSFAEDQAQDDYEALMARSAQDVAVKEAEMKHKAQGKQKAEAAVQSLTRELELSQSELTAAKAYYDKLKPDCVDMGLSYEERVSMRNSEIQSLGEAIQILNQQPV